MDDGKCKECHGRGVFMCAKGDGTIGYETCEACWGTGRADPAEALYVEHGGEG